MKRDKLPVSTKWRILCRDGFRCMYCGSTALESKLEIDHALAVSRGGTDADFNLLTACRPCNQGKGDSDMLGYICEEGCRRPLCAGPILGRDDLELNCQCTCHGCAFCDDATCLVGRRDSTMCPHAVEQRRKYEAQQRAKS